MSFAIYRMDSDAGGTKDWAIQVEPDKIVIKHGKTNKINRTLEIPLSKCLNGSTQAEAAKRVSEKTNKGYVFLCEGLIEKGMVVPEKADEDKRLFWSIKIKDWSEQDLSDLYSQAREYAQFIIDSISGHILETPESFTIRKNEQDILIFGLSDAVVFNHISKDLNKGHGETTTNHYPEHQILFFLAMANKYPEMALADHEGKVIDPNFHDCPLLPSVKSEELNELAAAFKLVHASIAFDKISEATGAWFY